MICIYVIHFIVMFILGYFTKDIITYTKRLFKK